MTLKDYLAGTCIGYSLRRTTKVVTQAFNMTLKQHDLTIAQLGVMAAIAKSPQASLSMISEELMLDDSTLTRSVASLEDRGLVRKEGGRGRGGKKLTLTDAGAAACTQGSKAWDEINQQLRARLSPERVALALELLDELEMAAEEVLNPAVEIDQSGT